VKHCGVLQLSPVSRVGHRRALGGTPAGGVCSSCVLDERPPPGNFSSFQRPRSCQSGTAFLSYAAFRYDRKRGVMEKDPQTITRAAVPEQKASERIVPPTPRPRAMSLEKAKKLIRKTSAEHDALFRRLAK
jgi:hypothetical protein